MIFLRYFSTKYLIILIAVGICALVFTLAIKHDVDAKAKAHLVWLMIPLNDRESICEGYFRFGESWIRDTAVLLAYEPDSQITVEDAQILSDVIIGQCEKVGEQHDIF